METTHVTAMYRAVGQNVRVMLKRATTSKTTQSLSNVFGGEHNWGDVF